MLAAVLLTFTSACAVSYSRGYSTSQCYYIYKDSINRTYYAQGGFITQEQQVGIYNQYAACMNGY